MTRAGVVWHAVWSAGLMHLWAEHAGGGKDTEGFSHPHPDRLLTQIAPDERWGLGVVSLRVPTLDGVVIASDEARRLQPAGNFPDGQAEADFGAVIDDETEGLIEPQAVSRLAGVEMRTLQVPACAVGAQGALRLLPRLLGLHEQGRLVAGASVWYWERAARLALWLVGQQRVVPMLVQTIAGDTLGSWRAWVSDEANAQRVRKLVATMPGVARASVDTCKHDPWKITEDFLSASVDAVCRGSLRAEDFGAALEGQNAFADPHVALLSGLLREDPRIETGDALRQELVRRLRSWIGVLEERGTSAQWRLLVRLEEPDMSGLHPEASPGADDEAWTLAFALQSADDAGVIVEAADIWLITTEHASVMGRRIERPQELLIKELTRAARFYGVLEGLLEEDEPTHLKLTTRKAYEFLREVRPVLQEQGFTVIAPGWWDSPAARLGAKLRITSPDEDPTGITTGAVVRKGQPWIAPSGGGVSVRTLVQYGWEISVGGSAITLAEFEKLAARRSPLVRVNGRWVEVRAEDVQAAMKFVKDHPGGEVPLAEAMRLAFGVEAGGSGGLPLLGVEATGWVKAFLNSESASTKMAVLPPPKLFRGTLRPYQSRGVSWMIFLERLGFGLCLADDMGLGKTIQLLAMLAYEREGLADGERVPPTLLLVPMSVLGNWVHETRRFCPTLKVLVHHGPGRLSGGAFVEKAKAADLVVTTYTLAHRDHESLRAMSWQRVVLDEAQYIKNPGAKQSQAARAITSGTRVALTGTPVENRLAELWSIMDFLNPGYLGGAASFRSRFGVAIERSRDAARAEQLRGLIRPFVLRRLKSDPAVVADLPPKIETREYSHLTNEQAGLYESYVKRMLGELDGTEGMQRRGLVLAALVRLKQICDHPSLVLKDAGEGLIAAPEPSRSGKCVRIMEMLDEVIAEGHKSLVFTQFRTMGALLEVMLRQRFGKEVLFLHGGVPQAQRQAMIDRFQNPNADVPVMLLSLKAGGVGLNLTAATHVFHFDRWWNPAVENQATDRAYRIGQTKTVQVHKFVVRGTLEERIDAMIESKIELAENIVGAGEAWISELSTAQLRDILTLRNDAVDDFEA